MDYADRNTIDIDETAIETEYGTVTLTFDTREISWVDPPNGVDPDAERLAREELALDTAMGEVSEQLGEYI